MIFELRPNYKKQLAVQKELQYSENIHKYLQMGTILMCASRNERKSMWQMGGCGDRG